MAIVNKYKVRFYVSFKFQGNTILQFYKVIRLPFPPYKGLEILDVKNNCSVLLKLEEDDQHKYCSICYVPDEDTFHVDIRNTIWQSIWIQDTKDKFLSTNWEQYGIRGPEQETA